MLTQIPKALLNAHLNIMLEKTAILKQMSAAPFCKHYVTFCTEGKKNACEPKSSSSSLNQREHLVWLQAASVRAQITFTAEHLSK